MIRESKTTLIISTIMFFIERNNLNNKILLSRKRKTHLQNIRTKRLNCIIYENFIVIKNQKETFLLKIGLFRGLPAAASSYSTTFKKS